MFGQSHFYHRTIRRLSVAFGAMFNDIKIQRWDNTGTPTQTIQVPLSYAPSSKWLARQLESSSIDNSVNDLTGVRMLLPRMSYSFDGIVFDAERAMNPNNRMVLCGENGEPVKYQGARVPFNLSYTLNVITKKTEDGLQIIEQILPWFAPDVKIPVVDMPDLNLVSDISIELDDVSYEDNYEDGWDDPRELIWTLSFTLKAWLYKPTKTPDTGIIKDITLNFREYCDWNSELSSVLVSYIRKDFVPENVEIYEGQTQSISEFDITEVRSAKFLVMVRDVADNSIRQYYQVLVTHNGTDAFHVRYSDLGDSTLHTLNSVLEDGKVKLQLTNNESETLFVRFIRMDIGV